MESGAPAIVPGPFSTEELAEENDNVDEAFDRLEHVLCAFFLHSRFEVGRYALEPAARPSDGFEGTPSLVEFEVSRDHLRLFKHTHWTLWAIDGKRPYGNNAN